MDQMLEMEYRRSENEMAETEIFDDGIYSRIRSHVADPKLAAFFATLLWRHRTISRPDSMAVREQYLVQCPACDGHVWQVKQPGDAEYMCDFWERALEYGLLPVGTSKEGTDGH